MKQVKLSNYAASVRARLLNLARERGEDLQSLMVRYALERLLYRIGRSREGCNFVLKGAMLFSLWGGSPFRATKDLDLLGFGEPSAGRLGQFFRELCGQTMKEEGLVFDPASVRVAPIREGRKYEGIRVQLKVALEQARIALQVDVGFGDQIIPEPQFEEYPTLLPFPAPRLRAYPMVTVIAEKFQIIVELGLPNSRMKDYFDLLILSAEYSFKGWELACVFATTFGSRETPLPMEQPFGLSMDFAQDRDKMAQWKAFMRKTRVRISPGDLTEVVETLNGFLLPPAEAAACGKEFNAIWEPGGPWRPRLEVPKE